MQKNCRRRYKSGIREKILNHKIKNINIYFKILIIFIIGICIGIFTINQLPETGKQTISEYINNSMSQLKSGVEIQKWQLLRNSLLKNIIIVFAIWFFSLTMFGNIILYFIAFIIGMTFGYTLSALMTTFTFLQGLLFFITSMLLQNIIFIPSMFFLLTHGIKTNKELIANQSTNFKFALIRNSIYTIMVMILLIIASFVEVYISGKFVYSIVKYL